MKKANCKSCGAAILWAQTPKGKWIPLDAEPSPEGQMFINCIGLAARLSAEELTAFLENRYMPHHATCPNAASYRKAKR